MRTLIIAAALLAACAAPRPDRGTPDRAVPPNSTFANPLDLEYRFMPEPPSASATRSGTSPA